MQDSVKDRIFSVAQFEPLAGNKISPQAYGYYISGSDDQVTLKNNISAFKKIYLNPRVLVDMNHLTMKTKILGELVDLPFGIAPFALQKLLHPKGEVLTATQACKRNVPFGLSMLTTTNPKQIAAVNPNGIKIQQLYFMKNAQYTIDVIRLAQKLGFKAFAITVDTQAFGKRRRDERNVFSPQVTLQLFNQLGYNFQMRNVDKQAQSFVHQLKNDMTWDDIRWIRKNTTLKIILKGVISPRDIPIAEEIGVDAIWISNHGGRQLDTSPATILALPPIRHTMNQIKSKMELYIDGGIKTGGDIFKCLALGADFVFLGKGFIFSLPFGEQGVSHVFDLLINELKTTMMLCGTDSVSKITNNYILKHPKARF